MSERSAPPSAASPDGGPPQAARVHGDPPPSHAPRGEPVAPSCSDEQPGVADAIRAAAAAR